MAPSINVQTYLITYLSISQVIGCEDRLWNDIDCVRWVTTLLQLYVECFFKDHDASLLFFP